MYALRNPVPHETLSEAMTRWSASASTHLLGVLLWSGALGSLGVMMIDPHQWPVGMGMVALAAAGAWGLLEHRLAARSSRSVRAAELVVATVALVAALVALFVGLFVFLGPAPHF